MLGTWQGIFLFEHRRNTPEAADRAAPDRRMSLESVRAWLAEHAPDLRLIEVEDSTATVDTAAKALGVEPGRIAKTLAVRAGEHLFLLVTRGDARLDNRKCKDEFGARPRMLGPEETLEVTGHPVGGVCPFGLKTPLPVYRRRVAAGVRRGLSGRRLAQHVGRGDDANVCSSWSASAGSTYAGCRRKRAGLSSSALTSATGHGVPRISDAAIARHGRRGLESEPALPGQPEEAFRIRRKARRRVTVGREGPEARPAAVDAARP